MSDLDLARRMLAERNQCSVDYEADDAFAAEVGLLGLEGETQAHRRRVRALGQLVKLGEAEAWWTGIPLDAGWHGARRARMYTLVDPRWEKVTELFDTADRLRARASGGRMPPRERAVLRRKANEAEQEAILLREEITGELER